MGISFAGELNAQQLEAVEYTDGPCLVVAGAGSGKTRMLTYKIAYLLQHGYQPWSIMALTFTNKAAREMKERISKIVGGAETAELWAGTFHSVFAKILRIEAEATGYGSDYTIYDHSDSRSVLKKIIKELELDDKRYKPAIVGGRISMAKNHLFDAQSYAACNDFTDRDKRTDLPEIARIYSLYEERCKRANAMDFDDLLLQTYKLLCYNKDIREKYRGRFKYLLVDEYQDTNAAQYQIIRLLANAEGRVCVVGDDAQSIYAFRGADIGNILNFSKTFPETKVFKLERNYRSTQNIVNAANSIIAHNQGRIPKNVYSELPAGGRVKIIQANDEYVESFKIFSEIQRLEREHLADYGEVAVLYRTNAQSRVLEECCSKKGIPYKVYGGLSFYQRKEVKDFMAYLRLCCNPADEEALLRIINFPARGIGATTLTRVTTAARRAGADIWDVIEAPAHYEAGVSNGTISKLGKFRGMMQRFKALAAEEKPYDVAKAVLEETGLKADMVQELKAGGGPEAESRIANTEELLNSINDFQEKAEEAGLTPHLADYLAQAALLTDQDRKDDNREAVTLMTVHAAKGLEFEAVFVSGMEDDLFPTSSARYSIREMEEERRLFYVAVTRAKQFCYISYAQSRRKYGITENALPSPFLDEIDSNYVEVMRTQPGGYSRTQTPRYTPRPLLGTAAVPRFTRQRVAEKTVKEENTSAQTAFGGLTVSVGDEVVHERFGQGRVLAIAGTGENAMLTIDFKMTGQKKLLLKFAKLSVVH